MKKLQVLTISLLAMLLCISCGGTVMETKLNGFDQGKLTLKFNLILKDAKTPAGAKAYKLDSLVHHAIGTKSNLKTERQTLLNEDLSLLETTMTSWVNKDISKFSATVEGGRIMVKSQEAGKPNETKELNHVGPIYAELHPLLYFRDLTKKGDSKTYPILTSTGDIRSAEVRYIGEAKFYEKNKAHNSRHYKIQSITQMDEYDDYYLDPKTGNIIKIEFGNIKFVPANN